MAWFRAWCLTTAVNIINIDENRCLSPPNLRDRPIARLAERDFYPFNFSLSASSSSLSTERDIAKTRHSKYKNVESLIRPSAPLQPPIPMRFSETYDDVLMTKGDNVDINKAFENVDSYEKSYDDENFYENYGNIHGDAKSRITTTELFKPSFSNIESFKTTLTTVQQDTVHRDITHQGVVQRGTVIVNRGTVGGLRFEEQPPLVTTTKIVPRLESRDHLPRASSSSYSYDIRPDERRSNRLSTPEVKYRALTASPNVLLGTRTGVEPSIDTLSSLSSSASSSSSSSLRDQSIVLIIATIATVLVTIVIVIIMVLVIVSLTRSKKPRPSNNANNLENNLRRTSFTTSTSSAAAAPRHFNGGGDAVTTGIVYNHKSNVLYFIPKSPCDGCTSAESGIDVGYCHGPEDGRCTPVPSEETMPKDNSREAMSLIPGRDINHEGPMRVYKWTDF